MGREGELDIQSLTPDRWRDLENLFGPRGACGGCWCMWWKLKRSEFEKKKGEDNRRAFKALVDGGEVPGLLAYEGGEPVGWCAVAPREAYPVLQRSRVLKPVDERPTWSVPCFFIRRGHRGRGVGGALLRAAVDFARRRGAERVEGYPVEPRKGRMPDVFAFTGVPSLFERAGFGELARRSAGRPIYGLELEPPVQ